MSVPIAFLFLLMLASAVAMFARRYRVPYTVALVITGLAVSLLREQVFPGFEIQLHLTAELLFGLLLPVLIYEAAFHFEMRDFGENWKSIITLAAPGLVLGIFAAGTLIWLVFHVLGPALGFVGGLLVAAVLAATDPVAVISLFRELGAPRRLGVIMEGESLVNDGVAVVVFSVVLVVMGLDPSVPEPSAAWVVRFFGWEIVGALLIGGAVGFAVSWVTARLDDHLIEITLTTLAAFGSFLLAAEAHASGVIACLLAGMLTGNFGAKHGMSATTRVAVASFWEYMVFLANSFVFLLVGLEVSPARLLANWLPVVLVWLALLAARALLVYAALPLLQRLEGRMRRGEGAALVWGGLRGGIAMVLALSIPRHWGMRDLVVDVVFGTCLLTILVQGISMSRLLRRMGLVPEREARGELQAYRGRLRAIQAAVSYLDRRRESGSLDEALCERAMEELEAEMQGIEASREDEEIEARMREEEHRELARQLLQIRKAAVHKARADRQIGEAVARRLVGELDERLAELDEQGRL
ncbi:MAG: cation:proton antiporter [Deltaproteobacteria bacterium]|nr:cation:proton antiporter [Deltaproteobacteria bacterium]